MSASEPGRELDALVAEKVMGLDLEAEAKHRFEAAVRKYQGKGYHGNEQWPDDCRPEKREYFRGAERLYSADMAAAWEVVEKLKADGWDIHIDSVGFNNDIEGEWRTFFSLDNDEDTQVAHVFEDGDTAPHAICRAALAALEAKQPT